MSITLQELISNIDMCIDSLKSESKTTIDVIQRKGEEAVEKYIPEGMWGTPFLRNAFRENIVTDKGDVLTFEQGDKAFLPEPDTKAPEGTIQEFLEWWNSSGIIDEAEKKRKRKKNGRGLPDFKPWWRLSKLQKQTLEEKRAEGMFGGETDIASYWWVQEVGHGGLAGIRPQKYFSRFVSATQASARYWISIMNKKYLKPFEK